MGMTDKIMDKISGRSSSNYRFDSGTQRGGMIGKMKDSFSRMRKH